jgi:hypothetical protein
MKKFQNVNFKSVDEFLDYLPDNERKIVNLLRFTIFDCLSIITEKLSYNVPFYYHKKRICFIWPSSVPWGNVKIGGVQLGFCYGHLLNDDINYLEKGNRKQVYIKTFSNEKEIETDIIKMFLYEALEVDNKLILK